MTNAGSAQGAGSGVAKVAEMLETVFADTVDARGTLLIPYEIREGYEVIINAKGKWKNSDNSGEYDANGHEPEVHPGSLFHHLPGSEEPPAPIAMLIGVWVPSSQQMPNATTPQDLAKMKGRAVARRVGKTFKHRFRKGDGYLYLCMNDLPHAYHDNHGSMDVEVHIAR